MATTMDLERLSSDPSTTRYRVTLADVKAAIPTYGDGACLTAVAALIFLDQHAGKDSDHNALVVHWSVALWLVPEVVIVDEERKQQILTAFDSDDPHTIEAALAEPFRVRFVDPDGQKRYPVIDDLERTVRTLSNADLNAKEHAFKHECTADETPLLHMFTATSADGEFI